LADFSSTIDTNKILVPFEFKLGNLENMKNILDEMKKAAADLPDNVKAGMEIPRKGGGGRGGSDPSTSELYPGSTKDISTKDPDAAAVAAQDLKEELDALAAEVEPSAISKKVEAAIDKLDMGVASEGLSLLKNPQSFIMGLMSNPAVAAALIAAGYLTIMLEISMMQSGALDKHFRRIVTDELIKAVRPLQRRMTQVGIGRQVIFTSESGSTQPGLSFNSYAVLRRGEINQVDSFQIRNGYKW